MTIDWPVEIKKSQYQYSEPVTIRKWGGGKITVKVGYVQKHPEKKDLVLEKNWAAPEGKSGHQQFNIKNIEDWKQICIAVNSLWPELEGVVSESDIKNAIQKIATESELLDLLSKYPEIISNIPKNINLLTLTDENKKALFSFLEAGRDIANQALSKLAKEPIEDVEQLVKILDSYKLSTVNSLVTHVTSRLSFIDTFEKIIHNNDSYERKGADSVHNLLKANIWMVNRNYSIMHDDITLKRIILEEWQNKVGNDEAKQRPDFLCMTKPVEKNDLIALIEIKRPSVKLTFSMLEQVMKYREILQKYSGTTGVKFKAFLVSREIDSMLSENPFIKSGITIKTYTDFIGEARRFYKNYLDIVEKEQYAI